MRLSLEAELNGSDKVVVMVVTVVLAVTYILAQYGNIVLGWFVDA